MSAVRYLHNGAAIMVVGNLIFLLFAAATFIRIMSGGIALGVDSFNGVTVEQLNELNTAIMYYSKHVHMVVVGFAVSVAIFGAAVAWYGVRNGQWWAFITAVFAPVAGLIIAMPMHYMGLFEFNWVYHLGIIYLGVIVFGMGASLTLIGLIKESPVMAHAS